MRIFSLKAVAISVSQWELGDMGTMSSPSESPSPLVPSVSLPLHASDDFFTDVLRRLLVPIEVHRVGGTPLRPRTKIRRVAKHLRQRHARRDDLRAAA